MSAARALLVMSVGILCLAASPAQAWHGYPPFGAWAYGSGYSPAGIVRTRAVYRSRPAFPFGWGRVSTARYSYRSFYRAPVVYRPYVYPRYVFPRYTYYPVVSYPLIRTVVTPVVPVVFTPVCSTPTTYSVGVSLASSLKPPINTPVDFTTQPQAAQLNLATQPSNTATSAKLVSTANSSVAGGQLATGIRLVPAKLLNTADAILLAGGYKQAGTAYAQLSVRYGSSPQLLGRRFIAQVFAGNLEQAEVILELAQLINGDHALLQLESASLNELWNSPAAGHRSEQLAKRAYERPTDAVALQSVAQWLSFQGDVERAAIFAARASQLASPNSAPAKVQVPTKPSSDTFAQHAPLAQAR